jgi:hypothetical protein
MGVILTPQAQTVPNAEDSRGLDISCETSAAISLGGDPHLPESCAIDALSGRLMSASSAGHNGAVMQR